MDHIDPIAPTSTGAAAKKPYQRPALVRYGDVRTLTQSGTGSTAESNGLPACIASRQLVTPACNTSDRRAKQAITRIGTHPLGFGMYLFSYKPEHRHCGEGVQFGVMAQEVQQVMPEAVHLQANGFLAVDYDMLGIQRTCPGRHH